MRRPTNEDGTTLVELLLSIVVIGIILTGLASVVMASLRATVNNEREVRASALASQLLEELQTLEWDNAALYDNEVAAADERWSDRLGEPELDGLELVTRPAPGDPSARNPQVPELSGNVEHAGIDYTFDRYIVWVDRDGDGTAETKRFVTYLTWNATGRDREYAASAERAPLDAAPTSTGTRVLQFTVTPNPADLDDEGRSTRDHTFTVKTNRPVTNGELAFYAIEEDEVCELILLCPIVDVVLGDDEGDEGDPVEYELVTANMNGTRPDPDGGAGFTVWTLTLPEGSHRYATGTTDVRFTANDVPPAGTPSILEAYGSITYRGGNIVGPLPRPPSETDGGTSPWQGVPPGGDDDDPADDDDDTEWPDVAINTVSANATLCAANGNWRPNGTYNVTVTVAGLTSTAGDVRVTHDYWTSSNHSAERTTRTRNATFISGGEASSTWRYTISSEGNGFHFKPGESISFTVDARNPGDNNDGRNTPSVQVVTAC